MVIVALTPGEVSKHKRAIEKIKRKLFARHTPTDYGIVPGSEEIIGATSEERWCASIGEYRKLTLGGVRFTLQIGSSRYSMTVSHVERDVFSLHVSSERGHTELSRLVAYERLADMPWEYIRHRQGANGR